MEQKQQQQQHSMENLVSLKLPNISQISSISLVIRNDRLLTIWDWLKKFHAIGICFALTSVLFWSFNGLSYKLNHHIHALEILTISSLIVSISYIGLMFTFYGVRQRSNKNDWNIEVKPLHWSLIFGIPGERISLVIRCLCGTISLGCFYCSYRYIPLGDSTTIRFTSPVFIAIFAHFIVNEPFGLLQIINSLTTLIGVILIGRPSFIFGAKTSPLNKPLSFNTDADFSQQYNNSFPLWKKKSIPSDIHTYNQSEDSKTMDIISIFTSNPLIRSSTMNEKDWIQSTNTVSTIDSMVEQTSNLFINDWSSTLFGVFLSLIAAISISISMIFMRKLKKTPPPLIIFWFSLSNVILGTISLLIIGEYRLPIGYECWLLILMTTLCTGFDQLFITLALKLENAGAVAVIQALCVVLSFIFSISILHEPLYWTSALGGAFIFFSVLVLGCSKLLQEMDYSNIKSTIFAINILHSNSKKFKLDDAYSKLSTGLSSSRTTLSGKIQHVTRSSLSSATLGKYSQRINIGEPYLLRVAPILDLCSICVQNMNNNDNDRSFRINVYE